MLSNNDCWVASFTRSRLDSVFRVKWPSFPGDGRWFQGEAGRGLVRGGIICVFSGVCDTRGPGHHPPHPGIGCLVSWLRSGYLKCPDDPCVSRCFVASTQWSGPEQTMPGSTRYCISLTLPSLFSFVRLWSDWGYMFTQWMDPRVTHCQAEWHTSRHQGHQMSSFRPRKHNYRKFSSQWLLHYPDHT